MGATLETKWLESNITALTPDHTCIKNAVPHLEGEMLIVSSLDPNMYFYIFRFLSSNIPTRRLLHFHNVDFGVFPTARLPRLPGTPSQHHH